MIKYGMAVVGVLLVMGILWPVVSGVLGKKPNEATRLVEATERTNNKAESLNRSFTDVIPPAPVRETYRPPASALGTQASGTQATGAQATGAQATEAAGTPSPQDPNQEGPVPTPTPDPYAHPSEHAVRDAMEFLNRLQTEMEPTQTEYIQAVEQLQRAWTPRYKRANDEFKRFARRIDHSDAMAQEYFLVQQNLTVLISSPKERRRAEVIDGTEREVYLDWRDQAFKTLGQAKLIMLDLHDMNIIITKQSLSAHFAALYEEFQTIPPAITMLHEELARFREESEKIQQTFGGAPVR